MQRALAARAALMAVALLGVFAAGARAQTPAPVPPGTYDFVTDNNNGNYTVLPNGSVTISLFFRETLPNSSIVSTLERERSLISEGVRITRTGSPSSPAVITAADSDRFFNISPEDRVEPDGSAALLTGFEFTGEPPPFGAPIIQDSSTVRRVRVGQITVRAGLIPFQTSTFTLTDPLSPDPDTFTIGDPNTPTVRSTIFDQYIQARTFNVSVVPEPGVVGLLGFAAAGLMARRQRRNV